MRAVSWISAASAALLLGCGPDAPHPAQTTTAAVQTRAAAPVASSTAAKPSAVPEPAAGRWEAAGALLSPRAHPRVVSLGRGEALVFGGFAELALYHTAPAEVRDLSRGTAKAVAGEVDPYAVGARAGGTVLACGGGSLTGLPHAWLFDPKKDVWAKAPPMKEGRQGHTATSLGDDVLAVGGYGTSYLGSVERFDGAKRAWRSAAPLHRARAEHAAGVLGDGRVLVTGGIDANDDVGKLVVTIDAAGKETAKIVEGTVATHGVGIDAGGKETAKVIEGTGGVSASAELYDPKTDRWELLPPMHVPRRHHVCVTLADGGVLLVGGLRGAGSMPLAEAERWTPSGGFQLAGKTRVPRRDTTAALLPDGRVLVVGGGHDDSTGLRTTELFDPATASWRAGPPLADARENAALAVGDDGQTFVLGGQAGHEPLGSVERFVP